LIIGGSDFANGMVCSPIDCDSFVPGKEYTGLPILVPRPETNWSWWVLIKLNWFFLYF